MRNQQLMNQLKQEIAQEFGIVLGPDTSARDNGRIGGELTKRLVRLALEQIENK